MITTARTVLVLLSVIAGLALGGCSARSATVMEAITPTALGKDIYCTRACFDARFPLYAHHRGHALGSGMVVANDGYTLSFAESMAWRTTDGVYEPTTRCCWVVAQDPAQPTRQERSWMAHEHCHRVEDVLGWEAAAPLWNALPKSLHTHPEIDERLRSWRTTHGILSQPRS